MNGQCSICKMGFDPVHISAIHCGHTFHQECIERSSLTNKTCPMCRAPFTSIIHQLYFDGDAEMTEQDDQSPEKATVALLKEVRKLEKELREALKWKDAWTKKNSETERLRAWIRECRREMLGMRRQLSRIDELIEQSCFLVMTCSELQERLKEMEGICRDYASMQTPQKLHRGKAGPKRSVSVGQPWFSDEIAKQPYLSSKNESDHLTERSINKALKDLTATITRFDRLRTRMTSCFWDPNQTRPLPKRLQFRTPSFIASVNIDEEGSSTEEISSFSNVTTDETREASIEESESEE